LSDGEEEDHRPGTIIYLRVSGDEQARDGVSLNTQEEKLRALIDAKDFRLPYYGVRVTVPLVAAAAATLLIKIIQWAKRIPDSCPFRLWNPHRPVTKQARDGIGPLSPKV
jgi:hypothetical protein